MPKDGVLPFFKQGLVQMYHIRRQNAMKIFQKNHDFSTLFLTCSYIIWHPAEKSAPARRSIWRQAGEGSRQADKLR